MEVRIEVTVRVNNNDHADLIVKDITEVIKNRTTVFHIRKKNKIDLYDFIEDRCKEDMK